MAADPFRRLPENQFPEEAEFPYIAGHWADKLRLHLFFRKDGGGITKTHRRRYRYPAVSFPVLSNPV